MRKYASASPELSTLEVAQEEANFELLITGMLEQGYGICDAFLSPEETELLRNRLLALREADEMHPAGVGKRFDFKQNAEVRGDVIRWLEPDADLAEDVLLRRLDAFIAYLNRTCFTGINSSEFHFAYYKAGSGYQRHLDQFKSDRGRKFSLVIYLNEHWQAATDGGWLRVYPDGSETGIDVAPIGGRAVLFKSDELEHEVVPAKERFRLSVAGWLKS